MAVQLLVMPAVEHQCNVFAPKKGRIWLPFVCVVARLSAYAYLVWPFHESGTHAVGVGAVVVVQRAIGVQVPRVGGIVRVRGAR